MISGTFKAPFLNLLSLLGDPTITYVVDFIYCVSWNVSIAGAEVEVSEHGLVDAHVLSLPRWSLSVAEGVPPERVDAVVRYLNVVASWEPHDTTVVPEEDDTPF